MASPPLSRRPSVFQNDEASTRVNSLEEFQGILESHDHVVVFCYEKYCLFCKLMVPVFENIAMTPSFEGVFFVRVNLKKQKVRGFPTGKYGALSVAKEISARYNVTKYPMVMYFSRSREIVRFLGARKKEEFEISLRDAIDSTKTEEQSTILLPTAEDFDNSGAVYCQGNYEDRTTGSLFSDHKRPFDDLERRCFIRPSATKNEMLTQMARANEGKAYFAVHFWNKPKEDPRQIVFQLDFINDGPPEDRFQSAMFQVTFAYDDIGQNHLPLSIVDIFPTSEEQLVSRAVFDADLGIDLESEDACTSPGDNVPTTEDQNLGFISGQGQRSPTASWNFVEAEGQGLNTHYMVSACLPGPCASKILMKFYGKAVHIRGRGATLGRNRVVLQVGSLEKPYERVLDLTEVA